MGDLNLRGSLAATSIQMDPEEGGNVAARACQLSRISPLLSASCDRSCGSFEIRGSCGVPFCSASNSCLIIAPKQIILSHHTKMYAVHDRSTRMIRKLLGFVVSWIRSGA